MDREETKVPRHVGIIMDGNGRWARSRGLDRLLGHSKGVDSVRGVVRAAARAGVRYLTVYAFSKENWGRPREEVEGLMALFCSSIRAEIPALVERGVRLRFIGERESLGAEVAGAMAESEQLTAGGRTIDLIVALNYGGRDEIVRAVRTLAARAKAGGLDPKDIDETVVSDALYTAGIPDPDLIIRTSNEIRVSNFLLWQMAYSELYFTDVLWPDFGPDEFYRALDQYARRTRRFGRAPHS